MRQRLMFPFTVMFGNLESISFYAFFKIVWETINTYHQVPYRRLKSDCSHSCMSNVDALILGTSKLRILFATVVSGLWCWN